MPALVKMEQFCDVHKESPRLIIGFYLLLNPTHLYVVSKEYSLNNSLINLFFKGEMIPFKDSVI